MALSFWVVVFIFTIINSAVMPVILSLNHLDEVRKERPEIAKKIEQHWTATDTQALLKGGHDKEKGK
ncbi:MAG: hypothetical protein NT096_14625 [Proteobacteria bacterium]|nr:hypothetical protein [Pseudomonadota bacterium]